MDLYAVEVSDVSFKYSKTFVLQNIDVNVPKGQIYALLGPSGSGKTTLLRLILGRIKFKSGTIKIFGNDKPGYFNRIIGYMPQSQALSPELTVGETMNYFASIYQLSKKTFNKEKQTLTEVLCLADDHQVVSTLSGGQQKALSLALVFLNSPKLVILDEPTVGTDPVLGNQIWSYLRSNCCSGLSVIIVTHYIQEASLADHVGMMRGGRLIEEGTPQSLYEKYNESNLETIFIKICTEKRTTKNEMKQKRDSYKKSVPNFLSYDSLGANLVNSNYNNKKNSAQIELNRTMITRTNYSIIWLLFILVRRNIQKFFNSKLTTLMLFSPIFCTLLMCITFRTEIIKLPVAVFNEDLNPVYSYQMQNITKDFGIYTIMYTQHHSYEDAVQAVKMGRAVAAIWFDKQFSDSLSKRTLASINKRVEILESNEYPSDDNDDKLISIGRTTESSTSINTHVYEMTEMPTEITPNQTEFTTNINSITIETLTNSPLLDIYKNHSLTEKNSPRRLEKRNNYEDEESELEDEEEYEDDFYNDQYVRISNKTIKASNIKVFIDNSNMFYAQPLRDMLEFGSWELTNRVLKDHQEIPLASPVYVTEVIYAKDTDSSDFLLSGYIVGFLYLSQVTLTSQLLIQERNDGFFDRAIVAGAKHSLMFFSHFITNFIFSLFQIAMMFVIGFAWYQIPNFGSHFLAFVLVVLQSSSSIMTGLLISSVCEENFSAFFIALSITLSQLFSSGAIFPIISFDPLIKVLVLLAPIAMPVESLRNVMLRGWTLTNIHVAHGLITNISITFIFGFAALFFFNRRS